MEVERQRRRFLQALLVTRVVGLGARPASADEKHDKTSPGVAVTWKHRWQEGTRARNPVPPPKGLPADFVPVGDHQKKTQHWVRPKDWPVGPTVDSRDGEILSIEFRIAKADFDRGFSWSLSVPQELRQFRVDHVDIDLSSGRHSVLKIPHYEIHVYFLPHGEHVACEL